MIVEIWPTGGGWRQGCASRCTGGARRGSIRPLSIGSSHCLNQYGCIGCLVMGGNVLSRPGGNLGFRVQGLGFRIQGLGFRV